MPALLNDTAMELEILQGLYDLQFEFADLIFLYTGEDTELSVLSFFAKALRCK